MADDGFFDNDPFESMVREIFGGAGGGGSRRRTRIQEEEEEELTLIELKGSVYIILELPGYTEEEVFVQVKDKRLEIAAQKKDVSSTAPYLAAKLQRGFKLAKALPTALGKKWEYTYKNGILEIRFS